MGKGNDTCGKTAAFAAIKVKHPKPGEKKMIPLGGKIRLFVSSFIFFLYVLNLKN